MEVEYTGFGKDITFNNDILPPYELFNSFYHNLNVNGVNFELIGFDSLPDVFF